MSPRRAPAVAWYLALALATGGFTFFVWRSLDGSASPSPGEAGTVAPDFSLASIDGGSVDLGRYAGSTVVVNFWASWCGPCEDEAATVEMAWRRWSGQGVRFIGVDSQDSTDEASAFVEEHGLTYPIGVDPDGRTAREYGVSAMPQTFVISPDGRVSDLIIGPVAQKGLDRAIDAATATS